MQLYLTPGQAHLGIMADRFETKLNYVEGRAVPEGVRNHQIPRTEFSAQKNADYNLLCLITTTISYPCVSFDNGTPIAT